MGKGPGVDSSMDGNGLKLRLSGYGAGGVFCWQHDLEDQWTINKQSLTGYFDTPRTFVLLSRVWTRSGDWQPKAENWESGSCDGVR